MLEILEEIIRESKDGDKRTYCKLLCSQCRKIIWREKRWIKDAKNCFCSKQCQGQFNYKRQQVTCFNCGKKIFKILSTIKINKTNMFFCNKECKNEAHYIKKVFQRTKIIQCSTCGKDIEVDYRVFKKRCLECIPTRYNRKIDYNKILLGVEPTDSHSSRFRKFLLQNSIKENKCEECGITEWNGKPLVIQLHHNDSNRKNGKLENLKMLCPNCHTQTSSWGKQKNKILT